MLRCGLPLYSSVGIRRLVSFSHTRTQHVRHMTYGTADAIPITLKPLRSHAVQQVPLSCIVLDAEISQDVALQAVSQDDSLSSPAAGHVATIGRVGAGHIVPKAHLLQETLPTASVISQYTATPSPVHATVRYSDEDQDTSSAALSQALQTLTGFLSDDNSRSPSPATLSITNVYDLYLSLRPTAEHLSLVKTHGDRLLNVLGAVLSTGPPPFDRSPTDMAKLELIERSKDGARIAARFITQLTADMARCGASLDALGRYWLLRANIAEIRILLGSSVAQDLSDLLRSANSQYRSLKDSTESPLLHLPYLACLSTASRSDRVSSMLHRRCWDDLVEHLCTIVAVHQHIPAPIQGILWQAILSPAISWTSEQTRHLIVAFAKRVESLHSRPQENASKLVDVRIEAFPTIILDTIFSPPADQPLASWALEASRGALGVAHDQAFRNLVLLALTNASPSVLRSHQLPPFVPKMPSSPAEADLRTVCILAILERELQEVDEDVTLSDTVADVVRSAWRTWAATLTTSQERPRVVIVAILSSFFRIIGQLCDAQQLSHVHHQCIRLGLFTAEAMACGPHVGGLYAEYAAAALACCQPRDQDRAFASVMHLLFKVPVKKRVPIIDQIFVASCRRKETFPVARLLLQALPHYNQKASPRAVHTVALALAQAGHLDDAASFLDDRSSNLTRTRQLSLLLPICKIIALNQRETNSKLILSRFLAQKLSHVIPSLFSGQHVPIEWRFHLVNTLLAVANATDASRIVPISQALANSGRSDQPFFPKWYWTTLIRLLLKQRRWKTALDLCAFLENHSAAASSRGRSIAHYRFARDGVLRRHALPWPAVAAKPPVPQTIYRVFRRTRLAAGTRHHPDRAVHALNLARFLLSDDKLDTGLCILAMKALVKAGRIAAAKKLRTRILERAKDPESNGGYSTKGYRGPSALQMNQILSNLILEAAARLPARRNGDRARKVLLVLQRLKREGQFTPDRVSLNIVLKALLQSTKMRRVSAEVVRALVDKLVRAGYPTHGVVAQGEVPFETPRTMLPDSGAALPVSLGSAALLHELFQAQEGKPISWKRHARPLYNMIVRVLYQRGDPAGARQVLWMLKYGDADHKMHLEAQGRATVFARRRRGMGGSKCVQT